MATGAAGTGKTFEVSYALTDEEIKLLAYVTGQKRARIAPFRHYYVWVFIAGIVLSYSGGAIAHSYYGVPLDSRATALVMALFATFIAGAMTYRWLVAIWTRRISAWRLPRLKETAHLQMDKDGFAFSRRSNKWHAAWEAIEDVTISSGAVVLWYGPDVGFMVPLRAIPPEERSAFVDAIKAWALAAMKGRAAPLTSRNSRN